MFLKKHRTNKNVFINLNNLKKINFSLKLDKYIPEKLNIVSKKTKLSKGLLMNQLLRKVMKK